MEELFPGESAPFLQALLLGDDGEFTEEQESDLSETGLYHITAVSGMHFGYLFLMLSFLVGIHRPGAWRPLPSRWCCCTCCWWEPPPRWSGPAS